MPSTRCAPPEDQRSQKEIRDHNGGHLLRCAVKTRVGLTVLTFLTRPRRGPTYCYSIAIANKS